MTTRAFDRRAHRAALERATVPANAESIPVALTDAPGAVTRWLADLSLLGGVPFWYLIPDARMLPANSIRFFHLDPNWIGALLDGALSIGGPLPGAVLGSALQGLKQQAAAVARTRRRDLLGLSGIDGSEDATVVEEGGTITGFLLNSPVIAPFPRIQAVARRPGEDDGGKPLRPLRLERLQGNLLFGLFAGTIGSLTLSQPTEGVNFGLTAKSGILEVDLRNPADATGNGSTYQLGDSDWSDSASSILAAASLAANLQAAVGDQQWAASPFTAAEFALEMVAGVGCITYTIQKST